MTIYSNVAELIGNTPLLELCNIEKAHNLDARIIAKVERGNPGGSIKDRVALSMIQKAQEAGIFGPETVIIEPTSGNTGVGLAMLAARSGNRCIIVMPDTMSVERQRLMKAYGAELVLTDGALSMSGAVAKADELAKEIPNAWIPAQFDNPNNPIAHIDTTGPEIWAATEGKVDIVVAGAGTGGTVTGLATYLKQQNPDVRVVAVEPAGSPLISEGRAGKHDLQGIGANFIPSILNVDLLDEVITITNEEAYEFGRKLAANEGLLVGITSGAAVAAAVKVSQRPENAGKMVVAILPDTGERYLSTNMFNF